MNAKKLKISETTVRDRLLDTADRLFYKEGFRAVGIDRVLAEAGAAKASLYAHFGSKDELVSACIERRTSNARAQIEAYVADAAPEQKALRFFDFVVDLASDTEFRGCPLQHLVSEYAEQAHPARHIAQTQRQWLLQKLSEWVADAGVADVKQTASALLVLFDGAVSASEQDGSQRARDARWCAQQLITITRQSR